MEMRGRYSKSKNKACWRLVKRKGKIYVIHGKRED